MGPEDEVASVDVNGAEYVEICVGPDCKTLWINVDGVCRFRSQDHGTLFISAPGQIELSAVGD